MLYSFRNWNEKMLRDNRVGANKYAKMEARKWINEVSGEALFDCYLTVRSREVEVYIRKTCSFLTVIFLGRTSNVGRYFSNVENIF